MIWPIAFVVLAIALVACRGVHLRRTDAGLALIFTTRRFAGRRVRVLSVHHAWQSGMDLDNPGELVFPYVRAFDAIFCGPRAPRRVLAIGGGGFSYPASLARRGIVVDAVEIDPAVVGIARKFFGLKAAEALHGEDGRPLLRVIIDDGARYLEECQESYDACVLDVYRGLEAVGEMASAETIARVREHLAKGGVLAVNAVSSKESDLTLEAWANALLGQFAHVWEIPASWGMDAYWQNSVLVASDSELDLAERFPEAAEL